MVIDIIFLVKNFLGSIFFLNAFIPFPVQDKSELRVVCVVLYEFHLHVLMCDYNIRIKSCRHMQITLYSQQSTVHGGKCMHNLRVNPQLWETCFEPKN